MNEEDEWELEHQEALEAFSKKDTFTFSNIIFKRRSENSMNTLSGSQVFQTQPKQHQNATDGFVNRNSSNLMGTAPSAGISSPPSLRSPSLRKLQDHPDKTQQDLNQKRLSSLPWDDPSFPDVSKRRKVLLTSSGSQLGEDNSPSGLPFGGGIQDTLPTQFSGNAATGLSFEDSDEEFDQILQNNPVDHHAQSSRENDFGLTFEDEDFVDLPLNKSPAKSLADLDYDFGTLKAPQDCMDLSSLKAHEIQQPESREPTRSRTDALPRQSVKSSSTHDYSQVPVNGFGFVKSFASDGSYLYFPKKKITQSFSIVEKNDQLPVSGTLLSDKISKLMDQVQEKIRFDKAVAANNQNLDLIDESIELAMAPSTLIHKDKQLWVDKYCPKNYVDLVGDEVPSLKSSLTQIVAIESIGTFMGKTLGLLCFWKGR